MKNFFRTFCLTNLLLMPLFLTGAPKQAKAPWGLFRQPQPEAVFTLEKVTKDSFLLNVKRVSASGKKCTAIVIANIQKDMWSHNKAAFSVRSSQGFPVSIVPIISFQRSGEKKIETSSARGISLQGKNFRDIVLNLDTDFRLGDAGYFIRQLKFAVSVTNWKAGASGSVEFRNVKLCPASEISFTNVSGDQILVIRPEKRKKTFPLPGALKIYFALDNEDRDPVAHDRRKDVVDLPQFGGFREMLLAETKGKAVETEDLEKADLIVCAASRPFGKEKASRIAEQVKKGTSLYAAGKVADPEIAELLPCTVHTPATTGLPVRQTIRKADPGHPILRNAELNQAPFGVYHQTKLRPGAAAITVFADGTPALAEGMAGKGKVIYSALGFGVSVIPGKKAMDPLFLRAAGYLGKCSFPEEDAEKLLPDAQGWYEGASKNSFGRFGWETGDGLTVGSISEKLSVQNGISEYAFSPDAAQKILLTDWIFTAPDGKSRPNRFDRSWMELGKVTLTAKTKIPEEWKNKKLFFQVTGGIDDTADVYFNGEKIGGIGQETPHYWDTPHRHRIPARLIREENEIRVLSVNLRGGGCFRSCPEIVVEQEKKHRTLAIDRINHIGKGGILRVDGKKFCRFDTSLAFPGTRWEFFVQEAVMMLCSTANFAAYEENCKIRIADLRKAPSLPVNWSKGWLLLFNRGEEENPLLLVFQHRMKSVTAIRSGENTGGLELRAKNGNLGVIVPVWIGGSAPCNTENWEKALPEKMLSRIDLWSRRALRFPANAGEFFRIRGNRIQIRDVFSYLETADDWKTPHRNYAPVPPLAFFTKGKLFSSEKVQTRDLPTTLGDYADADGTDTAEWSLPLPEERSNILPHVKGFAQADEKANALFARGSLYTGGGMRYEARNHAYPLGRKRPEVKNLNMHIYMMGLPQALESPFILNKVNHKKLLQRLCVRVLEPLERLQYKLVSRWREEPFSGIRYTNYMRSARDIATKFEPGFGTRILYGDSNESSWMFLTCLQRAEDLFGQWGLIRANYDTIRNWIPSFQLSADDWGYLACGCMDSGGNASIDMLNCEYSAMMRLARIAEIAGDEGMHAQALYRAARRMVPTLARLSFKEYAVKNKLLSDAETLLPCCGFRETGGVYRSKSARTGPEMYFDTSQGIPQDIVNLYRKYDAFSSLEKEYFPVVKKQLAKDPNYRLLAILALGEKTKQEELRSFFVRDMKNDVYNKRICRDWGGISYPEYFENILHRLYAPVPVIRTAKKVFLHQLLYDPETKTLSLDYEAHPGAELVIDSPLKLIPANGLRQERNGRITLHASGKGKQHVILKFEPVIK